MIEMKKKIWIECNHDGPIMYTSNDKNAYRIMLDDIEKDLGIIDILEYGCCFPVWIDTDDYKLKVD